MTRGKQTHLAIAIPRRNTCMGLCNNTAPRVPPSTISSAVGWTREPTCPPSRICPPMMATKPIARPARLILSTRLPLATLGSLRNLAGNFCPQPGYCLAVQLANARLCYAHHFANFPEIEILLIIQGHHHLFTFRQLTNGAHQQLLDALIFQYGRRISVVIGEMTFQEILIAFAGEILKVDELVASGILQSLLVLRQRHSQGVRQFAFRRSAPMLMFQLIDRCLD